MATYPESESHSLNLFEGDVVEPEVLLEHRVRVVPLDLCALLLHFPRHQAHLWAIIQWGTLYRWVPLCPCSDKGKSWLIRSLLEIKLVSLMC